MIQVPAGGAQAQRRVSEAPGGAAGRSVIAVIRHAHRDPGAQQVITRLLAERPDTIVVEMGLPVWRPPARTYLATYGRHARTARLPPRCSASPRPAAGVGAGTFRA